MRRERLHMVLWSVVVAVAVVWVTAVSLPTLHADDDDQYVPGQIIVRLNPASGATLAEIEAAYGVSVLDTLLGSAEIHLLQLPPGQRVRSAARTMRNDPRLLYAVPNYVGGIPEGDPSGTWAWGGYDPAPYQAQYAAAMLNLAEAHALTQGDGVVVAVLDTGVQLNHPQLAGRLTAVRYDFIGDDAIPEDEADGLDNDGNGLIDEGYGHGTHVAGIISLVAPDAQIMPLRVLDSDGRGNDFLLAEAIQFAALNGADVINLSLGMPSDSEMLEDVIQGVTATGVVLVAAAGNLNSNIAQYPAAFAGVLGVTAVGPTAVKSPFANYGDWVDIAAPGQGITSTFPANGYAQWSGTSMATAFVSGQAALLRSAQPGLASSAVALVIRGTAQPVDALNPGYQGWLGAGLINVGRSTQQATAEGFTVAHCGQVLTSSIFLVNDLRDCPGDGLVIGAAGITVDLNGRSLRGIGLGSGVRNDGYQGVTISNGLIEEFDYGVSLHNAAGNTITGVTARLNQEAGIWLENGSGNVVQQNSLAQNSYGIVLHGAQQTLLTGNLVTQTSNTTIWLAGASHNTLRHNTLSASADTTILLTEGANHNLLEANSLTGGSDAGIAVEDANGNQLIANVIQLMGDSAIYLDNAHQTVVRGNDLRFNAGGLEMSSATGSLIENNDASHSSGDGIEIGDGSLANVISWNTINFNGGKGLIVLAEAAPGSGLSGNWLEGNTAAGNQGIGIAVAKAGHTLIANLANGNQDWGIYAAQGSVGNANVAFGNVKPEQCYNVVCAAEPPPPPPAPPDDPPPGDPLPPDEPPPGDPLPPEEPPPPPPVVDCGPSITLIANADAWIEQNSPRNNKGSDSILKVKAQKSNDNFRALVRFPLPELPAGCVVETAVLHLYSPSWKNGRSLQAYQLGGAWGEMSVTWNNQPATIGPAATTTSGSGYRQWSVAEQVQGMFMGGNYGFLIRDATEGGSGAEQQFHAREKGEYPPLLIITFTPEM